MVREEQRRGLMLTEYIGGLTSQNMWMKLSLMLFVMKKLRFSLLSNVVRLVRRTELQSAASRLSI